MKLDLPPDSAPPLAPVRSARPFFKRASASLLGKLGDELIFPKMSNELRDFRLAMSWRQKDVTAIYGIDVRTYKRLEAGEGTPRFDQGFRKLLADWLMWRLENEAITSPVPPQEPLPPR